MEVLQLDVSGRPQAWLSATDAASLYATQSVAWTVGAPCFVLRGGVQRVTGLPSRIELHPIIAVRGAVPSRAWRIAPALTNPKLFARDRHICAYCGGRFPWDELTREHIHPSSRGGEDHWMNCITACRPCNGRKGNRMPNEARMSLLYLPYVPSLHEDMILRGRRILADQMDFLTAGLPNTSRLLQSPSDSDAPASAGLTKSELDGARAKPFKSTRRAHARRHPLAPGLRTD